ncbi:HBR317Wp [Eremothecium sinecaudum]|uniref:HBR317Wp n=1 Tax=Eremothecium sinecaudum TaxID=45286 RepID=A0A109UX82_9SACH|nr:HBR317Wp [Eremothecium sinecaudum]AMD19218.1 HBR317Wp [Eremothecium sinecaudum]
MNVYDEVINATVVNNCVTGRFTTLKRRELIITRTNILSVYHHNRHGKLILDYEWKLAGRIESIELISQNYSDLQCLVLLTGSGKLSIVRFDALTQSLDTLSLHYYEDKFRELSLIEVSKKPKLVVDPLFQCLLVCNNDCVAMLSLNVGDEEEEIGDTKGNSSKKQKLNGGEAKPLAKSSTVMPASHLHSEIKNIIDVQFLCGFNKPTLAILYQPTLAWCGNEKLTGQTMKYIMLSLDLEDEKSTVIALLQNLPNDLHTIIPLSNASILIGLNEMVYVDNTGALQGAVAVNSFASNTLSTKLRDSSNLEAFFHRPLCYYNTTSKGRDILLLMDENCGMYNVIMESEGRLLTGFSCVKIPIVNDIFKKNNLPTCMCGDVNLESGQLFMGFQSGDAMSVKLNNLRSSLENKKLTETIEADDEYKDLYGGTEIEKKSTEMESPFDIEALDKLPNIGAVTSLTIGKAASIESTVAKLTNPNKDELSIVATSGTGSGSHLTILENTIVPHVQQALKFISVTQLWNLKIKDKDKYLVTTDSSQAKSDIYSIDKNFRPFKSFDFKKNDTTVSTAVTGGGKKIVQVTSKGVYLFDTNFKRLMTMNFDFEVVHVCIKDPFLLLTNSKGDIKIYELEPNHKKKFVKMPLPGALKEIIITFGVILESNMCNKYLHGLENSMENQVLFTFVTADNQIVFFTKDHNDRIFQLNGVDQFNERLFISTYQMPDEITPDPSIKQVMLNKLGHYNKEEYLTILTFGGEIYQYKKCAGTPDKFVKCENELLITGAPDNAYAKGVQGVERVAHYIEDYNGYSVIFITGTVPYIIIKEDTSVPRIFPFGNVTLVSMTSWGKSSVMCVDDVKNARIMTLNLEKDRYYGNKMPLAKIYLEDVLEEFGTFNKVTFHERTQTFVVSYTKTIDYEALSEEDENIVGYDPNKPHAKGFQSGILLVNPKTWNIIDKIELGKNSLINDLRTMMIQLNSNTKRKREYLLMGNSYVRDEDIGGTGSFYLYDITEVVPEPGKPDTNYKFKEIFQEEIRGTVTTVCEISGRFMISQSSKAMVRDIQEDNSVVPVAFLDMPVFITDAKNFGNLMIIGDAMQGLAFLGFDAEPYRMITLGKSVSKFETVSLEFLVSNGDVYFLVSDRNQIMHVLKYAPDEPNSLSGQRLVHCTSFNLYTINTCMRLLKKNNEFEDRQSNGNPSVPTFQCIGAQVDGSIFKVVPISEASYRRLYLVQQQIIDKEIQLCGLNPRMERLNNDYYHLGNILRPLLDFGVLKRFHTLSIPKRRFMASKAGHQAHFEVWRDLIDIEYSLKSLNKN